MQITRLNMIYFSGTGTTKASLSHVVEGMDVREVREYDLSNPDVRNATHHFGPDELVLLGMPVYSGRIPSLFHDYSRLTGNGTPLVCVAVYGNRAYDDALLEMKRLGESNGFICMAAAAFVSEHNLNGNIARGRPDGKDILDRQMFGRCVQQKVEAANQPPAGMGSDVPGEFPYKKFRPMPFYPDLTGACIQCGLCARICPVDAIDPATFRTVRPENCIFCYRCVSACPENARGLNVADAERLNGKLRQVEMTSGNRRENEAYF